MVLGVNSELPNVKCVCEFECQWDIAGGLVNIHWCSGNILDFILMSEPWLSSGSVAWGQTGVNCMQSLHYLQLHYFIFIFKMHRSHYFIFIVVIVRTLSFGEREWICLSLKISFTSNILVKLEKEKEENHLSSQMSGCV